MIGQIVAVTILSLMATASDPDGKSSLQTAFSTCRSIIEDDRRLACFDEAARALDDATASGELVVMDRSQVRQARLRMFGYGANLGSFLGGTDQDRIGAIETTLTVARESGRGEWTFELADGSIWRQTDNERLRASPRRGQTVRVREGALGSFLLSLDGTRSVRVRREP